MSDEMKKIKELEEDLQDLQNERNTLRKKEDNLKLEYQVLNIKEQEIQDEINKIKSEGSSEYLGKFARIIENPRFPNPYYMYITSVNTSGSCSLVSFGGVGFYMCEEPWEYIRVQCKHKSAYDESFSSIKDRTNIEFITEEEYFAAFEKFQENIRKKMTAAVNARPRKKTKTEWKYEDDKCEIKD